MLYRLACFCLLLLLSIESATAITASSEKQLKKNLVAAKSNRTELEKAIAHFKDKGDTLELDAVKFLIANMADQGYIQLALYDSSNKEIPFDIRDYKDFNQAYEALKKVSMKYTGLSYRNKKEVKDLDSISSEFLIQNVELAFVAWRTLPWAKSLTYKQFQEYVLPYRGTNEPLDNWRKTLFDKYRDFASQLKDSTDPVEAAMRICTEELRNFVYDSLYYMQPTDQNYSDMEISKRGRCEDQTNLMLFVARANALAVLSDYVPFWGNTGNNHNWNSVLNRFGKAVWLEDGRSLRQAYDLTGQAAKVFRKTFSRQSSSLAMQLRPGDTAPPWLDDANHIDVSNEYMDVADVNLHLDGFKNLKTHFAYLCVFNSGQWRPIDWTKITNGEAVFHNMGKQIAYCPALCEDNKVEVFGGAFLLNRDGNIKILNGDNARTTSVTLYATTPKQTIQNDSFIKEAANPSVISPDLFDTGFSYQLFYWDNDWKIIGTQVIQDPKKPLTFTQVPVQHLYWLVKSEAISSHEERIFTIEDGKQIFW